MSDLIDNAVKYLGKEAVEDLLRDEVNKQKLREDPVLRLRSRTDLTLDNSAADFLNSPYDKKVGSTDVTLVAKSSSITSLKKAILASRGFVRNTSASSSEISRLDVSGSAKSISEAVNTFVRERESKRKITLDENALRDYTLTLWQFAEAFSKFTPIDYEESHDCYLSCYVVFRNSLYLLKASYNPPLWNTNMVSRGIHIEHVKVNITRESYWDITIKPVPANSRQYSPLRIGNKELESIRIGAPSKKSDIIFALPK